MKNYIKLLVPIMLLSAAITYAQDNIGNNEIVKENVTEYKIIDVRVADDLEIYEETKLISPVVFEKDDAYKLNQDRILVAPSLETTFRLDIDRDSTFEREITINYIRPENFTYDFMLTEKGLKVWSYESGISVKEIHKIDKNNQKRKVSMLTTKGMYNIILTNGEVHEIEVTNMK